MLTAIWPSTWSRTQRSNATLVTALLVMIVVVAALGQLLALLPEPIGDHAAEFAEGARTTLYLTLISGAIGLVLGVVAALARTSGNALLRTISGAYIWIIRGTPLLVQILFMYFALPVLVPGLNLPDFAAAVIALALNVGAYNAEAVRAGLNAVPRGQTEAARALGLPRSRVFLDVVFPQAFKISLPPLVSNFVALLKDSSLAYAIGVVELTNVGNRIQSATFQPVETLITVGVTYLVLTTLVTQVTAAVEYRFDVEGRQKRAPPPTLVPPTSSATRSPRALARTRCSRASRRASARVR